MAGPDLAAWRVLPPFIVRPSGFAFDRLVALRFVRSRAAAGALAVATQDRIAVGIAFDRALAQERYGGLPEFDDPVARKQLSRHIKRARAFARGEAAELPTAALAEAVRVVPRLAALADELAAQHARGAAAVREFEAVFARELEDQRAVLRQTYAADERLREAVFLESPEAFERVEQLVGQPGPRDARARQRERLAAMYLQRFCAKNDTNSICGPLGVGWIAEHATVPALAIDRAGEQRRSYFSHWAAERLLALASERAGTDAHVPIRLNPTARVTGAAVSWCAVEHDATVAFRRRYARANLPEAAVAMLAMLAQRPRTRAELLERAPAELAVEPDELAALIDELCEAGVLLRRPALAPGLFDPLGALIATLDAWPGDEARRWGQDHARALQAFTAAFGEARLPERLAVYGQMVEHYRDATGDTAERGQGRHYADRTIVHEDCHAPVRAALGSETIAPLLTALVPLVDAAALPLDLAREAVRQWFRARFGEARRVPVFEAHRAFDEDRATEWVTHGATAEALRAGIARVKACFGAALDAAGDGPARVSSAALEAALAGTPRQRAGYVSVDLMLGGAPGTRPALVLGEVHGFCWLPTCLLDVVPEPARSEAVAHMARAMRELAGGRPTLECLFAHTQATDRRFPITDADLVLIDAGDRPGVAFGQLDVVLEADELRFFDGAREVVPVTTYTTYPFLHYTSPLAPLVDDFAGRFLPDEVLPAAVSTGDAPRMLVDELTFRRRTWLRPVAELAAVLGSTKDGALFLRAHELRARLACPSVVFAAFPNEPKPVLVDFDNFFLVESFAHLVARQAPDARVRITEMLPGPDALFATAADGSRTSELRMGFYRLARSG
ncbi:MAG: lantibiotic dehydratase [Kofleriaceae bacterium]